MCGFSTRNLSYGELSCSLLFGSNRLMPRVRLNKSFMRSSGQKKQPLLCSSLFLKVPFCERGEESGVFPVTLKLREWKWRKDNVMEMRHFLKTTYSKTVFTLQQQQQDCNVYTFAMPADVFQLHQAKNKLAYKFGCDSKGCLVELLPFPLTFLNQSSKCG